MNTPRTLLADRAMLNDEIRESLLRQLRNQDKKNNDEKIKHK